MLIKVWNAELPPFPREGIFHLEPAADCPVTRLLCSEASRLCRLSQFDAPENHAELLRFQRNLRRRLREKLGTRYDASLPLELKEYGTLQRDGYTIRKITYQSRPGIHVPALLYLPEGAEQSREKLPAVVHLHGHFSTGKLGERIQLLSQVLAKSGYICLAPDAFGVYERADVCHETEYHGGFPGSSLLNIGETLMGAQLVDNMRAVDVLLSLPFVDGKHIGAAGASGGGNQTMYLAAMDERIAAAMPVVSVGSYESYVNGVNCVCELLPDGLTFTDEAGVLALIAPRPLNIGNALYDCNHTFSVGEMLKTYHQVEQVYWNLGCPENIRYTVSDRVHGMSDRQREAVIGWMNLHLKGIGNGNPVRVPASEVEDLAGLCVFASGKDRPPEVRPTTEHCRIVGTELHREMLAKTTFSRRKTAAGLAKILRLRPLPPSMPLKRYREVEGCGRFALDAGDHLIPIVIKAGRNGRFKLLLSTDGKSAVADEWIASASADGSSVVLCDLFGTGETSRSNHVIGHFHQTFRQLLWVGRSLPGEWVYDILAVIRMLRRNFHAEEVSVEAEKETGLCAVFAAAVSREKFPVTAIDAPGTMVFSRDSIKTFKIDPFKNRSAEGSIYAMVLFLPGFLQWGDVSLAAALAGEQVRFRSLRAFDGAPWSEKQEQDFLAEIRLLRDRLV